jgi:hypothetical protein
MRYIYIQISTLTLGEKNHEIYLYPDFDINTRRKNHEIYLYHISSLTATLNLVHRELAFFCSETNGYCTLVLVLVTSAVTTTVYSSVATMCRLLERS